MADEEVVRSREWQDEVENVKNNSSKIIGRNKRGYDHDEKEIDIEAEKSRESRKHDFKERKKERREEKEYGSKDKDRSKPRVKENTLGKDAEKHGSRERVSSSRDKKEYQRDYEKDRVEPELGQEKLRDKIRAKDYDQIKHIENREHEYAKDKGRKHDKGKNIDHNRERSFDREREEFRDHGKDKEKERKYKGKERDKNKDINPSRERSNEREHDQSCDHVKDIAREGEKEKVVDRDRGLDREHERGKERKKVYDHHRDQDKDSESDKDKTYDKSKVNDKDHAHEFDKELERDKVREKDRERGKDREKEKDQDHYWSKEKEREKFKDPEKEKGGERNRFEKHKWKKRHREMEVDAAAGQDVSSRRDIERDISRDKGVEMEENITAKNLVDMHEIVDAPNKISFDDRSTKAVGSQTSFELAERLKKIKEERINGNSEPVSEVLSWVNKSRKLEERRNSEKDKAIALARKLDEQDKILDESEDELIEDSGNYLAGVKVLHGLDKVMEGAAVVLTLKDQNIIANDDVNEEVDMLESVEIGEQKRRNEAYIAAKRKTGIYDDKFSEDLISRKTILPQYDDPVEDDGVFLDESWRFIGQAEKKLVELRKRIEGNSLKKDYADLSSSVGKIQTDYFTSDEMLQFKRSKKKNL